MLFTDKGSIQTVALLAAGEYVYTDNPEEFADEYIVFFDT